MVGFDTKNKQILDPKFVCPVCSLTLRNPVQLTVCGHRQCQSCFDAETKTTITCPVCQSKAQPTQVFLDRGFKNDMQSLPIYCSLCQWTGVLHNYQEHLDQSHPHPKCEYCAKQFDSENSLHQHKVSECPKMLFSCGLKNFGCEEEIIRNDMEKHYLTQQHQEIILKCITLMIEQSRNAPTGTKTNVNGQHGSNESSQSQTNVKLSKEESCAFMQGIGHNPDIFNQDLASLKEYASFDGTLVWKIANFKEKMTDAQSERQTSIYSPPFYSSPTGYKMRARLYLHGDGSARRTHMSLFFVLMRSEYDAILKFPFDYKVTFCLYDQTGSQRHIIDSFRPDVKSISFQRPRSDMNIASGIPKFFPLAMIQQEGNPYVRDDTMFIKVMVDFGDMPKTLLPYALSLNPGIPTNIQQLMIKEEAERRASSKHS